MRADEIRKDVGVFAKAELDRRPRRSWALPTSVAESTKSRTVDAHLRSSSVERRLMQPLLARLAVCIYTPRSHAEFLPVLAPDPRPLRQPAAAQRRDGRRPLCASSGSFPGRSSHRMHHRPSARRRGLSEAHEIDATKKPPETLRGLFLFDDGTFVVPSKLRTRVMACTGEVCAEKYFSYTRSRKVENISRKLLTSQNTFPIIPGHHESPAPTRHPGSAVSHGADLA